MSPAAREPFRGALPARQELGGAVGGPRAARRCARASTCRPPRHVDGPGPAPAGRTRRRRARWRAATGRRRRGCGRGRPGPASGRRSGSARRRPAAGSAAGPRSAATSVGQRGDLGGDALQQGPHQVSAAAAQRHPGERCGGRRVPPRGRQAGERGHAQHAVAGIGCDRRRSGRRRAPARGRRPSAPRRPRCRPARRRSRTCARAAATPPRWSGPTCDRAGVAAELGQQERAGAEGALGRAGRQAAFGEQRGLLVDDQPGDRDRRRRKRRCCRRSRRRRRSRAAPRRSARTGRAARRPMSTESRSSSSDRLAVEASVTNAPHSRCTSQVSVVVTTPSRSSCSPGSTPSSVRRSTGRGPDRCARRRCRPTPASGAQIDSARRSCHTIAGRQRAPGVAVPGQHGLALVGQGHRGDRNARLRQRLSRPASTTESNRASGSCSTPPPAR